MKGIAIRWPEDDRRRVEGLALRGWCRYIAVHYELVFPVLTAMLEAIGK